MFVHTMYETPENSFTQEETIAGNVYCLQQAQDGVLTLTPVRRTFPADFCALIEDGFWDHLKVMKGDLKGLTSMHDHVCALGLHKKVAKDLVSAKAIVESTLFEQAGWEGVLECAR